MISMRMVFKQNKDFHADGFQTKQNNLETRKRWERLRISSKNGY